MLLRFTVGLLCLSSSAFASHIYEVPTGSLRVMSVEDGVVDSIPQLGIVVTRSRLNSAGGLRDLGESSRVQLIKPLPATVPSSLWGLKAIRLSEAWKSSQGAGVVVAVSDTGVDAAHKELASQMWKNPGESGVDSKGRARATNGVDDDGNGYVDDVYGWDFVKKKNGGVDHHYHGTHVAGTIAAVPGKSMVGVAPQAKIMDVSFLDSKGSGSDVNGAKSIVYAVDQGARVINCSWGSAGKANALLKKAVEYAEDHGVLVIAAAGNDGSNNDKKAFSPSGIDSPVVVSVGATSSASGTKASFSNYGAVTVDLAAPGENIYSLAPSNGHQSLSGTSMATPHVAGVAALVLGAHPQYSAAQVKRALMAGPLARAWKGKSVSGALLEAQSAVMH